MVNGAKLGGATGAMSAQKNMNFGGKWVYGILAFFIVLVVTIAIYIFTKDDASDRFGFGLN